MERSNGGERTESKCWKDKDQTCENCLEEVQGAATSSLFPPPQDTCRVYSSCVRSAMLHASETWPLAKPNHQRLQRNDKAMIRQICNVNPQDIVTTRPNELLEWLGVEELDLILKERRLIGIDMWNAPMAQSRQPLTYRLMESIMLPCHLGPPRPMQHGSS